MQVTGLVLILTYLIKSSQCQMEPYIVDGHDADIIDFPYIAFLSIRCQENDGTRYKYVCGSSILTQSLVLTAAHCTNECDVQTYITVFAGHEHKLAGASSSAHSFLQNEYFNEQRLNNDICIIRINSPLQFCATVKRVALMKDPPNNGEAVVAGWGMYNTESNLYPNTLQYAEQYVKNVEYCQKHGGEPGTICATHKDGYVARGDSGSPLVAQDYIQIGIVSYTFQSHSIVGRLDFYTDTAYYYDWIMESAQRISDCE